MQLTCGVVVLLEMEIQQKILTLNQSQMETFITISQRVPSLLILLTGGWSAVPHVPIFHCSYTSKLAQSSMTD